MALVALIVQIGVTMTGKIDSPETAFRFQQYLVAIYLAPMIVGIVLIGFSLGSKWRRMPDNMAMDRSDESTEN
jgi:hypothetical protein